MASRIMVVGSCLVDLISYLEVMPGPGETVRGRRFAQGFGGKGANQAVMAARLGGLVAMVGCVGDDALGHATLENLASRHVDATDVRALPGEPTGVAPIWVEPDGQNRIVIAPGANDALRPDHVETAFSRFRPDVVIAQLEVPQDAVAAAFAASRRAGALTILNPAPYAPIDPDVLARCDWLVANEVEFAALASEVHRDDASPPALASHLDLALVVTLGERGAVLAQDGASSSVPADPVTAVDTTGAGDAFVGAFAYALSVGTAAEAAARFGCRVASMSVARPGTQTSFPSAEEAGRP